MLQSILDKGLTKRINLKTPIPIVIVYATVNVKPDGVVVFREDIYGRDAKTLAALNGPLVFWEVNPLL